MCHCPACHRRPNGEWWWSASDCVSQRTKEHPKKRKKIENNKIQKKSGATVPASRPLLGSVAAPGIATPWASTPNTNETRCCSCACTASPGHAGDPGGARQRPTHTTTPLAEKHTPEQTNKNVEESRPFSCVCSQAHPTTTHSSGSDQRTAHRHMPTSRRSSSSTL